MDTSILSKTCESVTLAIVGLANAEADVKRIEELQVTQFAQEAKLGDELKQLESEMGAKVLAGIEAGKDVSGKVGAEIESRRLSLEMAKAVSLALNPKLSTARKAVLHAKAEVLRAEADRLQHEAERRQVITGAMLADLQEWEGCPYTFDAGQPQVPLIGGQRGGVITQITMPTSFTVKLFNRADALRSNAIALEQGRELPSNFFDGSLLAPFEIDFEAGAVRVPEPVAYEPPVMPVRTKLPKELEMLSPDKTDPDDISKWRSSAATGILDPLIKDI